MTPWLLVVTTASLLFFPVLGNLRPDLVSFLPSMRQYAGNWASATWAPSSRSDHAAPSGEESFVATVTLTGVSKTFPKSTAPAVCPPVP